MIIISTKGVKCLEGLPEQGGPHTAAVRCSFGQGLAWGEPGSGIHLLGLEVLETTNVQTWSLSPPTADTFLTCLSSKEVMSSCSICSVCFTKPFEHDFQAQASTTADSSTSCRLTGLAKVTLIYIYICIHIHRCTLTYICKCIFKNICIYTCAHP